MEIKNLKIAIIGAGNMGGALARGWAQSKIMAAENIGISDISQEKLNQLTAFDSHFTVTTSNREVIRQADIVLLAVKPWLVETVAKEISKSIDYKKQVIISIAAGVSFETLTHFFDNDGVFFRVIPNVAVEIGQGVSVISSFNAHEEQKQLLLEIFNVLGKAFLVAENQMDAFMALTSCGIAYALRYVRASIAGAVEMGISPQLAQEAVIQTVRGAVDLLDVHHSHPEWEIDKVTTPGGFTIKGLNEMEANGFSNAVIKGLKASYSK
ncbi:MAG TPA: pyrroline-5-carboxylate reductase [Paludibacteraceae bacterium]|jgi:pyrroline-5-carboxylate reductase|nr:pyrroline-5-carboxylate reductase [Paludibacteraceae bacterium]MBP9017284.1 pyrroline-5-carboxylate reductase [Paludibacteraceae bacterium]MDS1031223.1 pyrroline-5-carboxylate reductase [Porphyromonadaceae sp. NP-X]NLJ21112.1 pyrroline-5-carboxylate reductase [Bacteroidales bacterium]HOH55496.1 pyrroline-5-carboxylate reductase [Paludibacteraceae bacterium]